LGPEKGIDVDEKTASGPSKVVVVGTGGGVPVRTILTTIGLVAAAAVAVLFVMRVERVLIWMLVALFDTAHARRIPPHTHRRQADLPAVGSL
jgi:hypothetical protein